MADPSRSLSPRHLWAQFRYQRLLNRMAGPRLLREFAESFPSACFVEIGANDGVQWDHLREHILGRRWHGVMVEPVPYVFERLRANYGDVATVRLENVAISDRDGTLPFYYLSPPEDGELAHLPDWYDGIGSFNRDVILSHVQDIPDLQGRVVEAQIPALTFDSLVARCGIESVDLLVIDTEGYDWELLRSIDLARHTPRLLVYEHFHLYPADRIACSRHLEAHGYRTLEEGFDTFCLHTVRGEPLSTFWSTLRPAVPGVSKHDEPSR